MASIKIKYHVVAGWPADKWTTDLQEAKDYFNAYCQRNPNDNVMLLEKHFKSRSEMLTDKTRVLVQVNAPH